MGSKPWFVLAGLLACTAPPPPPLTLADAPVAPPAEPRQPGPEARLKLEISIKGGFTVIEVGRHIEIEATIRNVSPEPQKIVLSGDGSEAGWREPHVGFIAERAGGEPVPRASSLGRCGMFDEDWHDEIVTLPPGGAHKLEWLPSPSAEFALNEAGRVKLTLRYAYTAGAKAEAFDPGAMAGVPAFELLSNPLQLEISQPLVLTLRRRPGSDGRAPKLADGWQLEVRNTTDGPRDLPPVTMAMLELSRIGEEEQESHYYSPEGSYGGRPPAKRRRTAPLSVPPGATVVVPDLETFDFPWRSTWSDRDQDVSFELRLEGLERGLYVDMTAFNG
jgi:hypothetical protein